MELLVARVLGSQQPVVDLSARQRVDHPPARFEISPPNDNCPLRLGMQRSHLPKKREGGPVAALAREDDGNRSVGGLQVAEVGERSLRIGGGGDVIVGAVPSDELVGNDGAVLVVAAHHSYASSGRGRARSHAEDMLSLSADRELCTSLRRRDAAAKNERGELWSHRCAVGKEDVMADITDYEQSQIDAANASGKHTRGVHARFVAAAEQLGPLASAVREGRLRHARAGLARRPEHGRRGATVTPRCSRTRRSGRSPTTSRTSSASWRSKPALVGHSFGGLLAQILAGRGLGRASVAIDPAPFRGVLPLPISALKSASPVLGNPANHGRAVPLTYEQFRYAFANAVSETRRRSSTTPTRFPAAGAPLFQAATANLNPGPR